MPWTLCPEIPRPRRWATALDGGKQLLLVVAHAVQQGGAPLLRLVARPDQSSDAVVELSVLLVLVTRLRLQSCYLRLQLVQAVQLRQTTRRAAHADVRRRSCRLQRRPLGPAVGRPGG